MATDSREEAALTVEDLSVVRGHGRGVVQVVERVSFRVPRGKTLALVGESGSGKSSLARAIVGLSTSTHGSIHVLGSDVTHQRPHQRGRLTLAVQMVFQDPYSSLDSRMTVSETLCEALSARRSVPKRERRDAVASLLDRVMLPAAMADRYPLELSGGERQRVAIGRALAVDPAVLIADEVTSALDVSVQAGILNLLRALTRQGNLAMLFITHNITLARYLGDDIAVMHSGRLVEHRPTTDVVDNPQDPYTRMLMDSVLDIDSPGLSHSRTLSRLPVESQTEGC